MPLDSHSYLVSQGWQGTGSALREGAISRPLALAQKKTLAGLGKDRDEAFPFWDHLYAAAASAIKLKLDSDDEQDSDLESSPTDQPRLHRTSTGIISNKRPVTGISVSGEPSGSSTPLVNDDDSGPRMSLMSTAKREAARRNLYSRFFRGPLIGPDLTPDETEASSSTLAIQSSSSSSLSLTVLPTSGLSKGTAVDKATERLLKQQRKAEKEAARAEKAARKEAKQLKRELKEAAKASLSQPQVDTDMVGVPAIGAAMLASMTADVTLTEKKKRRKEKGDASAADVADTVLKVKKKRKRAPDAETAH